MGESVGFQVGVFVESGVGKRVGLCVGDGIALVGMRDGAVVV